jgi:hypothetical protein
MHVRRHSGLPFQQSRPEWQQQVHVCALMLCGCPVGRGSRARSSKLLNLAVIRATTLI